MGPFGSGIRRVVGGVLFVALAALAGPIAPGVQAADGAALTVHSRLCPVAFTGPDYYANCHDTPLADITYTLTLVGTGVVGEAVVPADGDLPFTGLSFGTYELQSSVPGDFASFVAYCADGNGTAVPFAYTDTGGVRFDLAVAGVDVTCDWYTAPDDSRGAVEEASVTIYKTTCPVGYAGTDFFGDCYGNPLAGIDFSLLPAGSDQAVGAPTNADGFVAFEGITAAGAFVILEEIPGDFNEIVVYCSADGASFPVAYTEGGTGIVLELTTADDLRCDWYNVPVDARGTNPTPVPTRAPTTGGVVTLPNTGGGATTPETGSTGAGLLVPLALLATIAAAIFGAARVQRPATARGRRRS